MSDSNPDISRGHCYFDDSGEEAPSRYIPCGNSETGHLSCCESGDNCLSSRACYNGQFGVTYLAGCTDESYESDSCPFKGDYSGMCTWNTIASSTDMTKIKLGLGSFTVMALPINGLVVTKIRINQRSPFQNTVTALKPRARSFSAMLPN
jgi:hypothetical protein